MVPSTAESYHRLLAADRRRDVLAVLADSDRPLTRRELARRVVARTRDDDATPDDHPDRPVDEAEIALHHRHLPPLLDAGVVAKRESDRFVATEAGCDLHRAERTFRAALDDAAGDGRAGREMRSDDVEELGSSVRRNPDR